MLFSTLIFAQMSVALTVRSERASLFKIGLLSNRYMVIAILSTVALQLAVIYWPVFQSVFTTVPLTAEELAIAVVAGVFAGMVVEVYKWVLRRKSRT